MSNNIKLQSVLNSVNLTLSEDLVVVNAGANYEYTQSTPSATWVVDHNLGKYCSVTVVDDNDDVVIGEIHYDSATQVTLTFTAAFTGRAFCN